MKFYCCWKGFLYIRVCWELFTKAENAYFRILCAIRYCDYDYINFLRIFTLKMQAKSICGNRTIIPRKKYQCFDQAPGPHPWPIIGNINLLGRFQYNPFYGFGTLTKKYGDIYSLSLGHTRCIVVNNVDLIKEVLNKNGKYFGGRPDFFDITSSLAVIETTVSL